MYRGRRGHSPSNDTTTDSSWMHASRGMSSDAIRADERLAASSVGSPVRRSDAPRERKASPRSNQRDGDAATGSVDQSVRHTDTDARRAVETAADALLQRLRQRSRGAAKPDEEETGGGGNQHMRQEPQEELHEFPPPLTFTQLRSPPQSQQFRASRSSGHPESPLNTQPIPSETSRVPRHDWHTAFIARARAHQGTSGVQLDLPDDTVDEVSSDESTTNGLLNSFLEEDSAVRDGELVLPQIGGSGATDGGLYDRSSFDRGLLIVTNDEDSQSEFDNDDDHALSPITTVSNRDVNVSKAVALKNAMVHNMSRLGYNEDLTRAALDAGVHEIEQYDSDCELAYVDIFLTLVKLVCDAHQDFAPPQSEQLITPPQPDERTEAPHAQFKWPVFDMAQFEFGNARPGTCFESVCVLINLPKVAMDRTEELMEVLSNCLFTMIGDPIQVLIPSVSATGRTKGHAFLEFDDPAMAQACAAAVDGLTWGRGPFGRIRARLFRQYQVKSPMVPVGAEHGSMAHSEDEDFHLLRRRQSPTRSQSARYEIDGDRDTTILSRDLSRDDLNASGTSSSGSWNRGPHASGTVEDNYRHRVPFRQSAASSGHLLLQHSLSSSIEEEMGFHRSHDDGMMRLGDLQLTSDDEDEESCMTESDMELDVVPRRLTTSDLSASASAAARARRVQSLRQTLPPTPVEGGLASRFLTNVSPGASHSQSRTPFSASGAASGVDVEGPWKAYCEELIARNREMQEQVAYARRRIAALGHNNQKLHLLIDRMERDRDGLLFENDLLQTQLHGYEDHERQQEALMKELAALRRRMRRRDQRIERGLLESGLSMGGSVRGAVTGVAVELEGGVMSIDELEEQLMQNILSSRKLDDLKEWEQMLEGSLARVRSIKEEIALELQKKLAQQQAEEQVQDHKLCVVCLSNEKSILCLPCRHLCLCQECSQHQELDKCPICRLGVQNMLLVYA